MVVGAQSDHRESMPEIRSTRGRAPPIAIGVLTHHMCPTFPLPHPDKRLTIRMSSNFKTPKAPPLPRRHLTSNGSNFSQLPNNRHHFPDFLAPKVTAKALSFATEAP